MRTQVRTLQGSFINIATRTSNQIRRKNVDVQGFQIQFVMGVDVSQRQQYQQSLESCLMKLEPSITIGDLLCRLSMHWDFLNYGLLEHTINVFGDASLQQDMQDYIDKLRAFRVDTKLCDFIDNWPVRGQDPPKAVFKEFVIKMKKKWEECTLEDVEEFKETLTHKFFLPNFVLLLREAEEGCVCLTWYTPAPIAKTLQESLPNIEAEFFKMHGIERVSVDGQECFLTPMEEIATDLKGSYTSEIEAEFFKMHGIERVSVDGQECFLTPMEEIATDLKGSYTSEKAFLTGGSSLPTDKPLPIRLAKIERTEVKPSDDLAYVYALAIQPCTISK